LKLFLIIYDADFDEDVMDALSRSGVTGYTKWDRVLGKGEKTEPKLDNSIWPGFNGALLTAVEKDKEMELLDNLRDLHERMKGRGVKVFSWPLEDVI